MLHLAGVEITDSSLPARALGAEDDGAVSYGRFRNFLVLLPPERLAGMDAETAWFESATIIPLGAVRRHHLLCPYPSPHPHWSSTLLASPL